MRKSQKVYLPFKRIIGIFGSIVGIVVCFTLLWWWIIPVNAIITKGHPFFVQERYGYHKKVFKIIKFRSMKLDSDPYLAPSDISEETQLKMETKFGSFLRKSSIDETPQLLNIFIGQMAFIGPRPGNAHNEEYLRECREQYTPNAFDVKPGISGYAQVLMKRDHSQETKALHDHEYAEKMSLWFDIKIFVSTIFGVSTDNKGK